MVFDRCAIHCLCHLQWDDKLALAIVCTVEYLLARLEIGIVFKSVKNRPMRVHGEEHVKKLFSTAVIVNEDTH